MSLATTHLEGLCEPAKKTHATQTPVRITADSEMQTIAESKLGTSIALQTSPRGGTDKELQTLPLVYVDLARRAQRPLDLICCIDSSVSVGQADFMKARTFLEYLLLELEMPPVHMGIIQFNHTFSVISRLSSSRQSVLSCLQHMIFEPGETKLGPPLNHAGTMLEESR